MWLIPMCNLQQTVTSGEESISGLLMAEPSELTPGDFSLRQKRDSELQKLRVCLESGILLLDGLEAWTVAALALHWVSVDDVLYFVEDKKGGGSRQRAAVPRHLQQRVMEDAHRREECRSLLRSPTLCSTPMKVVVEERV